MTEVSAQVTVILFLPFCSHWPRSRYIPPPFSASINLLSVLPEIHIPAHQELPLSSFTGVWLPGLLSERSLCECFSLSLSLSFSLILHPFFQSSRLVIVCLLLSPPTCFSVLAFWSVCVPHCLCSCPFFPSLNPPGQAKLSHLCTL